MVARSFAGRRCLVPFRNANASARREALKGDRTQRKPPRAEFPIGTAAVVEEGGVVAGGEGEIEFAYRVSVVVFLVGWFLQALHLQEARAIAKQLKGFVPPFEVVARGGGDLGAAGFPLVPIVWAVEGGLGSADEQTHHGDAFVRTDGHVADVFAALEGLAQADRAGLAVSPDNRYPRFSRSIHRLASAAVSGGRGECERPHRLDRRAPCHYCLSRLGYYHQLATGRQRWIDRRDWSTSRVDSTGMRIPPNAGRG